MALTHADTLLKTAQGGQKLSPKDRRHVITYLMATQPDVTNTQMAEWFQVSERQIRLDKANIRQQKAKFLKDELSKDIALVIADIQMDFERQVLDIEKSKAKAKLGSKSYLDHCTALMEMRLKTVKAFQDIGFLPKNLGAMTVERFDYKAVVNLDGSVNTRPADLYDPDKEKREALDAEFTDIPPAALPPASSSDEQDTGSTTSPPSQPDSRSDRETDSGKAGATASAP